MSNQYDEPTRIFPKGRATYASDDRQIVPVAIIACHPDPNRLGEFCVLDGVMQFAEQELNRHTPEFHSAASSIGVGLGVPQVSRKAMRLERVGKLDIMLHRQAYSAAVSVNQVELDERVLITEAQLQQGVELCLGEHVMILLKAMQMPNIVHHDLGLVGISAAMQDVRERINKVAPADEPVLIRGATGCGKELVAQAIYHQSGRQKQPFVAVNIAALQPSLAVSELFGATKGAYTGATADRDGLFQAANTGTLFLDEIGEASQEVQAMLLRALETHQVVPVGATQASDVDVRIIAATDANLEQQGEGSFKQPLLHRLSSYQIFLPPLRERREDIPSLLRLFMRSHWEKTSGQAELPVDVASPWLHNTIVRQLLEAEWPGNVRQLRNVTRQMLFDSTPGMPLRLEQQLLGMLKNDAPVAQATAPLPEANVRKRKPSQISRDELVLALRRHRYELQATADDLGISRASVYQLIERHPDLKHTADLTDDELTHCYNEFKGDLERMMEHLEVSQIGLRRRLRAMGLDA